MPDLQTLLNTVPTAAAGDIVTEVYHNSLRDTLEAVVKQISTPVSKATTLTFAPTFFQSGSGPNWGFAVGEAAIVGTGADGWLPIHLPDGTNLQSLTVIGQKRGNIGSLIVQLERQGIVDSVLSQLIFIDLTSVSSPFNITMSVQVNLPGLVPSALAATLADFQLVDNSKYKYLVQATLTPANPLDATALTRICTIQVTYTP